MRYGKEHKEETHRKVVEAASRRFRKDGIEATGVVDLMADVGLTHGGFYAHFPSKTAMDVEIVRTLLGSVPGRWLGGLEESVGLDWVQRAVDRYLSAAHRDNPDGCAYPAVLSEIATSPVAVRRAFAEALELRVRAFEAHLPHERRITARERALATMALTVGGLLLARAANGSAVSDEILAACRAWSVPEVERTAAGRAAAASA